MKKYLSYLIALGGGVIGVFAFSPFDQWSLMFLSSFCLLWAATQPERKQALLLTLTWAVGFFTFGLHWISTSIVYFGGAPLWLGYVIVLLLALYLSLYPLLFTYLIQRFAIKSAVIFPILWTFTEYLRGWLFTGFPWLQLGYSQIDSPFAGIAPLFGVEGISFFIIWISALLLNIIKTVKNSTYQSTNTASLTPFTQKRAVLFSQVLILLLLVSLASLSSQKEYTKNSEQGYTITLVQGNIEQGIKWDPDYLFFSLDRYMELMKLHLGKSDIIVFPETALPLLESQLQPYFQVLGRLSKESKSDILLGSMYQRPQDKGIYNSVLAINSEQDYQLDKNQRYFKQHLVPFGEYLPLKTLLKPLTTMLNVATVDLAEGAYQQPALLSKKAKFTTAICYEIVLGERLYHNLEKDSDFILTVSNDAWFGDSIGPWQHLQIARMRALELGKPVIRATNTGVTAFIQANGKIQAEAPQFEATTLTQKVYKVEGRTPYSVIGNKALYLIAFLLSVFHLIGAILRNKMLKIVGQTQRQSP